MLITGNWYLEHTEKGNYYQPAGSELLTTKLIAMGAFWGWNLLNFTWNLEQGVLISLLAVTFGFPHSVS